MTNATLLPNLELPEALPTGEVTKLPDFRSNAHIHLPPNFSAFASVEQAVTLAQEQGLSVLGGSNYYDYTVYGAFAALAQEKGIFPLFGLEIITLIDDLLQSGLKVNDPGNPGRMYLCGKGLSRFEPMSDTAAELLAVVRENDAVRMAAVAEKVAGVFAAQGLETGLDANAIRARIAERYGCPVETVYLQERHIAQAFQEALFAQVAPQERAETLAKLFGVPSKADPEDAVTIQGEIRSHLMKAGKPAFVEETFVGFDHAYRLILALGGVPCYPTLIDGANPICPHEADAEALIADLKARGIHYAEFIPLRNDPAVLSHYVKAMRNAGIVVTAGTEHNTPDLSPMEPTCLKGQPVPEDIAAIFREGACVIAAHQYRALNGQAGFVDVDGKPNADYATDEERIAAFAAFGAEVLKRYQAQVTA
jgi:hypothetical protein